MAQKPRFPTGQPFRLPGDLEEMGRKLSELPPQQRQQLTPLYDRVVETFRLRHRIMNVAKEALEKMRLELTCLQFDLEATRREKDTLKRQIDEN